MKRYSIEFPVSNEQWSSEIAFSRMRKSYADGAWAMLKAMYNRRNRFRLVEVDINNVVVNVIDEVGTGIIELQ